LGSAHDPTLGLGDALLRRAPWLVGPGRRDDAGERGYIVLNRCSGSGSTIIAAQKFGKDGDRRRA